jgi:SAM-dependent methyltransferase
MRDEPATSDAARSREGRRNAFASIYRGREWRGESASGPGSDPARTRPFVALIQRFLAEHNIRRVLDIGCGDWSTSGLIDWSGIDYVGTDIVAEVVAANQRRHGSGNISFVQLDAVEDELPRADLAIAKEVLQHLPIADIERVVTKLAAFPYAILVNDVAHVWHQSWLRRDRRRPETWTNVDIEPGEHRLLALREPPFELKATELLTYTNRYGRAKWVKQVLLLKSVR